MAAALAASTATVAGGAPQLSLPKVLADFEARAAFLEFAQVARPVTRGRVGG